MVKRTDNQSVVANYFNGIVCESHNGNLWVSADGKRLMNYSTCLVEVNSELGLIVNRTSYSVTTSKIQNYISSHVWRIRDKIDVYGVYQGTAYLQEAARKRLEYLEGMKQITIINYFDVWGNKKDGWEVNNLCTDGQFELHESDYYNHKAIMQKLKDVNFLSSHVRMNQLVFEDLHEFGVEIYQKKDMRPICRIEFQREELKNNG